MQSPVKETKYMRYTQKPKSLVIIDFSGWDELSIKK